jgi:hypothetical protein
MEKKLGSFLIQAAISECSNVSYGQAGRFSNDGYSAWIYRPFRNPTLWRERKTQKNTKEEFRDLVSLLEGLVRMLMWINLLSYIVFCFTSITLTHVVSLLVRMVLLGLS